MSYAIMRMEKRNAGNIVGMFKHNERKNENYSNEDINRELSSQNYQLIECDSYKEKINQEIKERYKVNKSIRKDAVLCVETVFTSDKEFFDKLTPEQERLYFEKSVEFLKEQFGEKNIIFATVHKDETTPHLHAGFIPMTDDGRLSYKNFVNSKYDLIKLQDKYFEKMVEFFPELERGQNSKETKARHLANQEYKIQQKEKAMELQLEQINKNAMELEEKKKKLEAKKERLKTEDEKLYDIEKIMECVKENKGFFNGKVTVTMEKHLYQSLLRYARDGEKYFDKYLEMKKSEEIYKKAVADINREKDWKIKELSRENEKLSKKKKELETKLIKLDKLEKLQEWLPQELKDLFEKYLQEQEKSRTRGKKIIKTWQEKLEDEKEQRQSKGIER
ncbi:MobV family relaxase [Brevibacillus sp. VP]|jgi:hypothetical protein|uniref:MobV family relaxase n=1 Tax=Brevibacillus sp. VP TaxID=2293326 RepID=UPI0013749E86|nr:MobV family relaxase [Brevibacillus sp. VP]